MLAGLFEPLTTEISVPSLEVTGELPAGLRGRFARVGPNPQFEPLGRYHMFDGDGMIHAFDLADGTASYANRWVETPALLAERRAGRSLYGGLGEMIFPSREDSGDAGPIKNPANTNLVRHAGKNLALFEGGLPIEFNTDLSTVGPLTFDGKLSGAFTAHPRIDPRTGEMFAFSYQPFEPYFRVMHINAEGALLQTTNFDRDYCHVMHDFAITENYLLFVESPLIFDLPALMAGDSAFRWDENVGTRIGLMARGGDTIDWIPAEDGYVNHFWNAWEEDGEITLSGSCILGTSYTTGTGGAADDASAEAEPGRPTQYTVNLADRTTTKTLLDDRGGDFPRINEKYIGLKNRYNTMSSFSGKADAVGHFDTITQYDTHTGTRKEWCAGPGHIVGEAVFAADPAGSAENDGWLLMTVHDRSTGAADLAVLDARNLSDGPVARVHSPQRLPFGFHANWFAN